MGNGLENHHVEKHQKASGHDQGTAARHALIIEFAGDLGKKAIYPGPASAGELLQKGAERLKVNQQDSIGSTMAAFKNANKWDPAINIHLTKWGTDHLDALSAAGVLNHKHTTNPSAIRDGSLVFGKNAEGKLQAAIKGAGDTYFHIGADHKWTKSTAEQLFAKGQPLDAYSQNKSFSKLTNNQREELAALADQPAAFKGFSVSAHAKALPYQLEAGVKDGRFTRQTGLNVDALKSAAKPGDLFISQDGSLRGKFNDSGKLQIWNSDIKTYHTTTDAEQAAYTKQQFRLYHAAEKK